MFCVGVALLMMGSLGGGGRSGPAHIALERPQRDGLRLARKEVLEAAPLPPDLLSFPDYYIHILLYVDMEHWIIAKDNQTR